MECGMQLVASVVTGNSGKNAGEPPTILGGKASCRRKFVVNVELKDQLGNLISRDLTLVASLAFAHDETPVLRDEKPSLAEPPLFTTFNGVEYPACERPTQMVNGRASFKLAISVLSSKCDNRLFCIAITPLQAEESTEGQLLPGVCYSGPIRSISRKRTRTSSNGGKGPVSPNNSMGTTIIGTGMNASTGNSMGRGPTPGCPLPSAAPYLHTHLPRLVSPTSSGGDSIGTTAEDGEEVSRHMLYRRSRPLASLANAAQLQLPTSSQGPLHRLASNVALYGVLLGQDSASPMATPLADRSLQSSPMCSQPVPSALAPENHHQEDGWTEGRGVEDASTSGKDRPGLSVGKRGAGAPLQPEHLDGNMFTHTPTSTTPPSPAFGPFRPYASIAPCRMPAKEVAANNAVLPAKKRRFSPSGEDQPSPNGPLNSHLPGSVTLPGPLQLQGLLRNARPLPLTRPTDFLQRSPISIAPEHPSRLSALSDSTLRKEDEDLTTIEQSLQQIEKEVRRRRANLNFQKRIYEEQESNRQLEDFFCNPTLQRVDDQGF